MTAENSRRAEIYELVQSGQTYREIAKRYGVSETRIGSLYRKHVILQQVKQKKIAHSGISLIEELGLSTRSYNALLRSGIETIPQLLEYISNKDLRRTIRNFGKTTSDEVNAKLAKWHADKGKRSDSMNNFPVRSGPFLEAVCKALGVELDKVHRLIIDAKAGDVLRVYVELFQDDTVLELDWSNILFGKPASWGKKESDEE